MGTDLSETLKLSAEEDVQGKGEERGEELSPPRFSSQDLGCSGTPEFRKKSPSIREALK